jgi:uncharacterized membrane protein required for colicin V production
VNLYDLVMLCLLGLLAFRGARRGRVRELAGLAALTVAFLPRCRPRCCPSQPP